MKTWKLTALALMITATGCVTPEMTTFVLENQGDAPVYHDVDFWLSLQADGRDVAMTEPVCMARCGAIQQDIACSLAARVPAVRVLEPGDTTLTEWDGVYYEIDGDCYRERTGNADFQVTFCYSAEVEPAWEGEELQPSEGVIQAAVVKDPVCEEVAFIRGTDGVGLLAE